ncbi:MAG: thioredoxin family protein [Chlamydiia bacterium]|nr:thioredoxin family protein [Chlamydiia bacterium]
MPYRNIFFYCFLSLFAVLGAAEPRLVREAELTSPLWVAVEIPLGEGEHIYWKNPGESGFPPEFTWDLPEGCTVAETEWPAPKMWEHEGTVVYGYSESPVFLARIVYEGEAPRVKLHLSWLACSSETCEPKESALAVDLNDPEAIETPQFFAMHLKKLPQPLTPLSVVAKGSRLELTLNESLGNCQFIPYDGVAKEHQLSEGQLSFQLEEQPTTLHGLLISDQGSFEVHTPVETKEIAYAVAHQTSSHPEHHYLITLFFAFLGGIILNAMPCVLPVISLKVMGFVSLARENRRRQIAHGLFFAIGVLLSFLLLASVMLLLKSYGSQVGWGFQLQSPLFVALLATLLLIMGWSLLGVFELGAGFASWIGSQQQKEEGLSGSLLSGVLATALATPCSGPFLGTAIGVAMTLPPLMTLGVFLAIGSGMACPYVLLSLFPQGLRWIPKPGPWMIRLKEVMGFVLMLTVLWLIWVFAAQTDPLATFNLLLALFSCSVMCWIWGQWMTPITPKVTRRFGLIGVLLFATISVTLTTRAAQESTEIATTEWETYSPERVNELQAAGVPVFIDFTAKWCLVCQANRLVLHSDEITALFHQKGVVRMIADWTKSDPIVTQGLENYGRNSVPLYVLLTKSEPVIFPQVLTKQSVGDALHQL